jgi:diguanylate cyclase (GGDEF)-like protein
LLFAVATVGIGVAGIAGVRDTNRIASAISSDEVATASATSRATRALDTVYAAGLELRLSQGPAEKDRLSSVLFDRALPAADSTLTALIALHADDGPAELADVRLLGAQWSGLRSLLRNAVVSGGSPSSSLSAELARAFAPLSAHLDRLITREDVDAQAGRRRADSQTTSTTWLIAIAMGLAVLATACAAGVGVRRVRRALRPEEDQAEFADTMQLADDETEAHYLLKRHLERAVPRSTVTVLNRNNSADRLEAMTELATGSCLLVTLQHAAPRACLAIRSGRTHREDDGRAALLACEVCSGCSGSSSCTPLTVGGEVIGSVLVNPPYAPTAEQGERVSTSVAQAAPILANLRNLAIAEIRAATDSLTGLPNKRAVYDTLKRTLAQASRTITPFALLLIDLDHFKEINDRLGHPVGDQALADVAAALTSTMRDSDFAGRNGGEEFAVLLPDTDLEGALQAADKIRLAIADVDVPGDAVLTASIGVALYPQHATSTDRLERLADAALYVAKRSGRNRVETATLTTSGAVLDSDTYGDKIPVAR